MVTQFQDEYRFLSNFWFFEKPLLYDGMYFKTNEHFYVACKTLDKSIRQSIANSSKADEVKKLGRALDIREDWDDIKLKVMLYGLRYKFSDNNPNLKKLLLDTGDKHIQEGNYWNDKFWGECLKTDEGENNLGKMLMQVRGEII